MFEQIIKNYKSKKWSKKFAVIGVFAIVLNMLIISNFGWNPVNIFKIAKADIYNGQRIVDKVNAERNKIGLKSLVINPELTISAERKAQDMSDNNYFLHVSPSGKKWSEFIINSGYNYSVAGENLAKDYENIDDLVSAWMLSPAHRDNILNLQVFDTGIAIKSGTLNKKDTIFVVQTFGQKL